jgi:hypothetical protein
LVKACPHGGRILIFAFCRAVPIFINRFLEVNKDRVGGFDRLTIVALPISDTIPRAGGATEIAFHRLITGETRSRDYLSMIRHGEVYRGYRSFLRLVNKMCRDCTLITTNLNETHCTVCGKSFT